MAQAVAAGEQITYGTPGVANVKMMTGYSFEGGLEQSIAGFLTIQVALGWQCRTI